MEKNSINSTKKTLLYSEFQNKKLKTYILVLNGGASISLTNMWDIRLGRGDASILIYIVKEDRAVATKIWGFRAATLINVIVEFPIACFTNAIRSVQWEKCGFRWPCPVVTGDYFFLLWDFFMVWNTFRTFDRLDVGLFVFGLIGRP